jgi:putative type I site-specific restriction-modification system, S subunit
MKESGIDWIGQIPEEWRVTKLKYALLISNGKDYKDIEVEEGGYPVIGSGGVFARARNYMYDGDVVLLGRKGTIDKPLFYSGKFWTVDTMFYSTALNGNNIKFMYYSSLLIPFSYYSTATALPSMTQSDLNNHVLCLPSISEQQKIADFLDKKTAQLDKVKSLLEEQIQKLKDYRASLIYETVTKGLDKTVPMKDSGIDWIGEVPEGWEMVKFKYFFNTSKGLSITKECLVDEGIPVINYGQIHSSMSKQVQSCDFRLPFVPDYYLSKKGANLNQGDFVFADTSEDLEGAGNFSTRIDSTGPLLAGYHTIIARLNNYDEYDFRYFMHLFDSLAIRKQIQNKVSGIKVYSITQGILNSIFVIIPPKSEQQKIANLLDEKTAQIDKLVQIKNQQIENINKQRQTLIYDYVTGKRRG